MEQGHEQRHKDEMEKKKMRIDTGQETSNLFPVTSAVHLMKEEKFLSLGCANLDLTLKGGIPNRGITQIYGAAGTGKTQFALQLCLTVQLPVSEGGCDAGAVYISTEGSFPSRRLQDLLRESDIAKNFNVSGDAIFVETLTEIVELDNCITKRLPHLLASRKIGLLVLDSIAAPFRAEYARDELKDRAKTLWNIAYQLHSMAKRYKLTVVCINQVSAVVSSSNQQSLYGMEQPALGITWANMITTNFYLCRKDSNRYLCPSYPSHLPQTSIQYIITNSGVSGIIKS